MNYQHYTNVNLDTRAATLTALYTLVLTATYLLYQQLTQAGVQSATSGTTTGQQAAAGAGWAIAEVAIAAALLGVILVYRWLPEWIQETVRKTLFLGVAMTLGGIILATGAFWTYLAIALTLYITYDIADHLNVYWIINDAFALILAVVIAAYAGILLGPIILGVGLIGLTLYDRWFADQNDWMFTLSDAFLAAKLPLIFIVPRTLRLDWDELSSEDVESDIAWGIGTADLFLPVAFIIALIHTNATWVVVGAAVIGVAVACTRLSWKLTQGSGAGLPALTTGVLGATIIAITLQTPFI